MTVRVRFAPSPTGYLHIGSARTALFNYLFAQHAKLSDPDSKFLLRIEDTDLARSTDESTRSILDGLAWLGFAPDEEIVFQSNNADKHRAAANRLLAEGKAYRDFTPKEQPTDANVKDAIKERARAQGGDKNMRDNPYRDLSTVESDTRAVNGEPFAIRLKVPESGKTSFEDQVYGLQERDYAETEDLVLLRSDGHPLYNLAVVCDDIEMAITHVIRGQDHLTNTHKQILIYEALGSKQPVFAHLPLILAPGGKKLSKRIHGEIVSMTTYRDAGFLAVAFRNFLALMGWSPDGSQHAADVTSSDGKAKENAHVGELMNLTELVDNFSLDRIHRSPAIFNFDSNNPKRWTDDKAQWMNAEYIRTMPLAELLPHVKTELKANKLWRDEYEDSSGSPPYQGRVAAASADGVVLSSREIGSHDWFVYTLDLIRQRFFTLKDFSTQGRAYFSEDFDFDPAAIEKNLKKFPDLQQWLPELADRFENEFGSENSPPVLGGVAAASADGVVKLPYTEENIETVVKTFTEEKGTKLGVIMNGARTLLTGVAVGPSMLSVFEVIGLERTLMRLRSGVAWNL